MNFRRLLGYPPAVGLLRLTLSDGCEERLEKAAEVLEKMTARFPEHFREKTCPAWPECPGVQS